MKHTGTPLNAAGSRVLAFLAITLALVADTFLNLWQQEARFSLTPAVTLYLLLTQNRAATPALAACALSGLASVWVLAGSSAWPALLWAGLASLLLLPLLPLLTNSILSSLRKRQFPNHISGSLILFFSAILAAAAVSATWTVGTLLSQGSHAYDLFAQKTIALGLPLLAACWLQQISRSHRTLTFPAVSEVFLWLMLACALLSGIVRHPEILAILSLPLMLWSALRMDALIVWCLNTLLYIGLLLVIPVQDSTSHLPESRLVTELAIYWISSFFLCSALAVRRQSEARLEERVAERTQDLQQANQQLRDEVFIRKQAEKSLLASSRKYRSLIETAGSPIVILDRGLRVRQWNRATEQLFGLPRTEIQGKHFVERFLPRSFQEESLWKINKVFEDGQTLENLENEILSASGKELAMLWNVAKVVREDSLDEQVIVIGQNITSIRETQNQLHFLAHYDVLTGAANRRLFEDRCHQALKQASRRGHDVGLIGLDVDHFKRINDTLGHDAGDTLLKELFKRMQTCVRGEDTIGRLGGDEFAILLGNVSGAEGCAKVAENLLKAITQPIQLPGKQLIITTSIGVTLAPRDGDDFSALLKNADMAMYRAKKNGRNNIQFYEPQMGAEVEQQMNIEQALRRGFNQNEFLLHFQPQIDLEDDRVIGFEALLRWQHPEKGLLPPQYFLEIAEQSGLLPTLSGWIIRTVIEQARVIQALSDFGPLRVSVNLSAREMKHPQVAELIEEALDQYGLDPQLLNVEVSEQTIVNNLEEATRVLNQIRELGVSVTVDSFGSGLSSLSHLASLPVDTLKVHHSLVKKVPEDHYDTAIFNTLIAISQGMGLKLVVEGLETEAQEVYFRSQGVRYVQGHRFSPPIPQHDLQAFFAHLEGGSFLRDQAQMGLHLNP